MNDVTDKLHKRRDIVHDIRTEIAAWRISMFAGICGGEEHLAGCLSDRLKQTEIPQVDPTEQDIASLGNQCFRYYTTAMIMTGDIAGARRRHALPGRRSCAGSADMPHPGAHASGVPLA